MNRKKILFIVISLSLLVNLVFFTSLFFSKEIRKSFYSVWKNKIGDTVKKKILGNGPPGKWGELRNNTGNSEMTPKQLEQIKKLESIGYLSGYKKAPVEKNVTRYKKEHAYNALNLLCSGHGPEALLMDMNGNILHKWKKAIFSVWPDYKAKSREHEVWRRIHLFENGDLLAIFDGIGLIKIDRNSKLIWANPCRAHHDVFVSEDKKIYVLTRKASIISRYNKSEPILEDFISILDQDGGEINKVSILKCFENSKYAPILNKEGMKGDIMHTNTIEVIEDKKLELLSENFKRGNILVAMPRMDLVCVIDMEKETVVWALANLWKAQHQPTILDNGNILIFDNLGSNNESRVVEFDPRTQDIFWEYAGSKQDPFFSETCGSCQRLPNGNTLISETEAGRAFEVTPEKEIVWEFFNPHRAGKDKQLIAAVYEVVRLNQDYLPQWLKMRSEK